MVAALVPGRDSDASQIATPSRCTLVVHVESGRSDQRPRLGGGNGWYASSPLPATAVLARLPKDTIDIRGESAAMGEATSMVRGQITTSNLASNGRR